MLDYNYFKNYYRIIATDFSKQQVFGTNPKAIQETYFIADLERAGNTTMLFIIEDAEETISGFSQRTVQLLGIFFTLI